MRPSIRLWATVKPARYLTANNPTGLTGLLTHPAPRSTLLYLYQTTLEKLTQLPEHSIYRRSTESLTKHRLSIVEATKPAGYEEWAQKARDLLKQHPGVFDTATIDESARGVGREGSESVGSATSGSGLGYAGGSITPGTVKSVIDGTVVTTRVEQEIDEREEEWDGEKVESEQEGPGENGAGARGSKFRGLDRERPLSDEIVVKWEMEPPLNADEISKIENEIGAGLIEEVIQVAEGELKLVDTMIESKVWSELEEKAPAGQWAYFARDQHTPDTQEPPNPKKG